MCLISYQYPAWTQAHTYQCQTNGHDPQPIYKNIEQLLSRSNQFGVSILTHVFEVYMLQVKVNRLNFNSYIFIYITYYSVEIGAIKMYVIMYIT